MVFAKFSCGTYVIVVLNSDIVALINKRNFFVFGSVIFNMVLLNLSIFSLRCYGIRYTPTPCNLNFRSCVYMKFYYKTCFNSVMWCPNAGVEGFYFSVKQ